MTRRVDRLLSVVVLACAGLLSVTIATAVTLASFDLTELFDRARTVAFVQITSGELIAKDGDNCGAGYRAKVITLLKGEGTDGDTIEFGPSPGYEIGSKYLVFLTTRGNTLNPIGSHCCGMIPTSPQEHEKRCAAAQPGNLELVGAPYVVTTRYDNLNGKGATVFVFPHLIRLPSAIVPWPAGSRDPYGTMLVPIDELVRFQRQRNAAQRSGADAPY